MAERSAYGDGPERFGDLHLPEGPGPFTPVVVIHGGFWLARYGADIADDLCRDLAQRGYAAWNIEYRRVGNGGGWPTTVDDVGAAIDHLAVVAQTHPLDLDRVVAVGHSAGGQLGVWAAARPGRDGEAAAAPAVPVRAVVCQAGVLDLEDAARRRLGGRSTQRFLGGEPEEVPERYAVASPVRRLPIGVPVVAVHGSEDDLVPPAQSRRYVELARQRGDAAELVVVEGEGHFAHLDPGSRVWGEAVTALGRVLA